MYLFTAGPFARGRGEYATAAALPRPLHEPAGDDGDGRRLGRRPLPVPNPQTVQTYTG